MYITEKVDKEKRTCVVILTNCHFDAIHAIEKAIKSKCGDTFMTNGTPFLLEKTYVGIAKCSLEDVWDEEVGLQLARDRASLKYQKAFNGAISAFVTKLDSICEAVLERQKLYIGRNRVSKQ